MGRTIKKDLNFNRFKTGCLPYLNEVKKMQVKVANRSLSEIKIQEIKKIVSSLFKEK